MEQDGSLMAWGIGSSHGAGAVPPHNLEIAPRTCPSWIIGATEPSAMPRGIIKNLTPEEEELLRKREEFAGVRAALVEREL